MTSICVLVEALEGGVARHIEHLVKLATKSPFRFNFILNSFRSPDDFQHISSLLVSNQLPYHEISIYRTPHVWKDYCAYRQILSIIQTINPTLIHTHSAKAGALGRWVGRCCHIPVVHTPHVFPFVWNRGLSRWIYWKIEQKLMNYTFRYIFLTHAQLHQSAKMLGEKVYQFSYVLPNAVDLFEFSPPNSSQRRNTKEKFRLHSDQFHIGCVARLNHQKGIDCLLHAAYFLLHQGVQDFQILIAGSGPEAQKYLQQSWAMGLQNNVQFIGNIRPINSFYHAMDCIVLPSRWEGCPYVILEAMACGLPVIASRYVGIEEILPSSLHPFIVPIEDSVSLAQAILHMKELFPFSLEWTQQIYTHVAQNFSLAQWEENMDSIYSKIIDSIKG